MDELKVEIALEIIQRKIVSLLKSNKDVDVDTAKETLKTLVEEREKIYNLDEETIENSTIARRTPYREKLECNGNPSFKKGACHFA